LDLLMHDARQKTYDVVVVWKFDRFAQFVLFNEGFSGPSSEPANQPQRSGESGVTHTAA